MSKTIKMVVLAMFLSAFLFTGCTRYANEEELKMLNDQNAAVKKAETRLADVKKERRSLEAKLAEKQNELKAAEEEKAAVESRLK
jgi:outer membrane murein-binding lipoprotein Lpp